jgi:hypothetical protein
LTIKNQPYTPTLLYQGNSPTSLVYSIQVKGHFGQEWIPMNVFGEGPKLSNDLNTMVSYSLDSFSDEEYLLSSHDFMVSTNTVTGLPPGSQIDSQVEALSGYWTRTEAFDSMRFEAQESGWSETQTVTLPGSAATATPNTYASPTQTNPTINTGSVVNSYWGLSLGEILIVAAMLLISAFLAVLIIVMRGRKRK